MSQAQNTNTENHTTNTVQNQNDPPQETKASSFHYGWPLFWGIFIILAMLSILTWLIWRERQILEVQFIKDNALVLELQEKNKRLEAELLALDTILLGEPCYILELLQNAQNNKGMLDGLTFPIILTAPIVYVGDERAAAAQKQKALPVSPLGTQEKDSIPTTNASPTNTPQGKTLPAINNEEKPAPPPINNTTSQKVPEQTPPKITPPPASASDSASNVDEDPAPPPPPVTTDYTGTGKE